jgi:hypothetical protein
VSARGRSSSSRRANNDDGEPQLRVIKGKTYNNRAGVKEETEPRWLEPVAVNGTTFDLVQNWDQLSLPPTVSGKTLGAYLRRLPYWQATRGRIRGTGRMAPALFIPRHVLRSSPQLQHLRHEHRSSDGPHR